LRHAVGAPAEGPRVRIARRVLDLERRVLIDPADGIEERMTANEFDLLKIFAENPLCLSIEPGPLGITGLSV